MVVDRDVIARLRGCCARVSLDVVCVCGRLGQRRSAVQSNNRDEALIQQGVFRPLPPRGAYCLLCRRHKPECKPVDPPIFIIFSSIAAVIKRIHPVSFVWAPHGGFQHGTTHHEDVVSTCCVRHQILVLSPCGIMLTTSL